MASDYYQILGVDRDATPDQIKRAYRKKAKLLHPDVTDDPQAEEKFKAVNEAYEVLNDPQKKAVFDRGGDPMHAGGGAGGFDPFGGFANFGAGGFDISDLMGAMFGGATQGSSRGPRPRVRRGQDQLVRAQLTLAEAAFGTAKQVSLSTYVVCPGCTGSGSASGTSPQTCTRCQGRGQVTAVQRSFLGDIRTTQACPTCQGFGTIIVNPCPDCSGEGRVRTQRTLTVNIPAGVSAGNRIHLSGQGEVGPGGGPAGDLYVEVSIAKHDLFRRDGDNLEVALTIPMTAAALGTQIPIRTLEADNDDTPEESRTVMLTVPAGTQAGARLVIKGMGVPKLRGNSRGDMGVTLLVETPTKLDDEQRDLLQRLAELRDETHPDLAPAGDHAKGFFGRLKDSFAA
jgi:molecular chaperone DnaJ